MNIINNDDREVAFKLEFYPNQDHDLIFIWTWIIAIVILGSYIYLAIYEKKWGIGLKLNSFSGHLRIAFLYRLWNI